ncbi:adenosine/AMP deaminase [Medicago truncatula]|uniref:Adenosine/AMP deaminase n=1 Tax=Medicago truncatula TaxID=3880 RepID=A0A072TRA9_MEDTR|nr:adenosine/AMP deaminase [Medicago truncatula]
MAEYRISVYGRKQSEWDQLASWFVNNALYRKKALPRLYNIYRSMGIVSSFQNILDNAFIPLLFEATVDPNSHPQLHFFLNQVRQSVYLCSCAHLYFVCLYVLVHSFLYVAW